MNYPRGFVSLAVLLMIVVGVAVVGGGAYYVVNQPTPPESTTVIQDLDTLPVANNNQAQQPNPKPGVNTTSGNSASLQLKTYTNAKWGYSIKYPSDWSVGKEQAILDYTNKIPSTITFSSADKKQHLTVALNQKEWGLKYEALQTEKITVAGAQQTAYIFPNGYEGCDYRTEDCSFFVVPILRDGVWYELHAGRNAKTITDTYRQMLSSFTFLPFDTAQVEATIQALPPDFTLGSVRFGNSSDSQKVLVEFIVENLSASDFSGNVIVEVREEGRQEVLAQISTPGRRVMADPHNTQWFSISFDKSKIVGTNKEHPALDIRVNPSGAFGEVKTSNNTVHVPAY